ncbi:MAG: hypothetical protein MUC43_14530 [Pirellula sp.]|jgi:hypothetical protein|nr:hypothetical protein [Pirellula sp.]
MSGQIYLLDDNSKLHSMRETPYDSESLLQTLLAKYPHLLAGEQMDMKSPRRWILISQEFGVPGEQDGSNRWSLDHLFIDQDGIPTLVEVKRSSDTRIRREVVGQMLDYAANAVSYWSMEKIRARFESQETNDGLSVDEQLMELLGPNADVEAFWERVKTNLIAERIRLVFVADVIPSELRAIVEYLNRQMSPTEVLAVEVKQFVDDSSRLKTLVPTVIGQTVASQTKRSASSGVSQNIQLDEFIDAIESQGSPVRTAVAKTIIDWASSRGAEMVFKLGSRDIGFTPGFRIEDRIQYPIALKHDGLLVFRMRNYDSHPQFAQPEVLADMRSRLESLPGFNIRGGMQGLPCVKVDQITKEEDLNKLLQLLDWFLEKLRLTTGTH